MERQCKVCKRILDIEQFAQSAYKLKDGSRSRTNVCKDCYNLEHRLIIAIKQGRDVTVENCLSIFADLVDTVYQGRVDISGLSPKVKKLLLQTYPERFECEGDLTKGGNSFEEIYGKSAQQSCDAGTWTTNAIWHGPADDSERPVCVAAGSSKVPNLQDTANQAQPEVHDTEVQGLNANFFRNRNELVKRLKVIGDVINERQFMTVASSMLDEFMGKITFDNDFIEQMYALSDTLYDGTCGRFVITDTDSNTVGVVIEDKDNCAILANLAIYLAEGRD